MKSILDRTFRYVPSEQTSLRETFARVDPHWHRRPAHLPSQRSELLRINGWTVEPSLRATVTPIKERK